jgi:hypothetical protein
MKVGAFVAAALFALPGFSAPQLTPQKAEEDIVTDK